MSMERALSNATFVIRRANLTAVVAFALVRILQFAIVAALSNSPSASSSPSARRPLWSGSALACQQGARYSNRHRTTAIAAEVLLSRQVGSTPRRSSRR